MCRACGVVRIFFFFRLVVSGILAGVRDRRFCMLNLNTSRIDEHRVLVAAINDDLPACGFRRGTKVIRIDYNLIGNNNNCCRDNSRDTIGALLCAARLFPLPHPRACLVLLFVSFCLNF